MASVAALTAVAIAGTAVQANQQKIAAQKQQDAMGDAQKAQDTMIANQNAADAQRKAQEQAATQQAFTVAASNRNNVSGAALPNAVTDTGIGNVGNASQAAKTLIGG